MSSRSTTSAPADRCRSWTPPRSCRSSTNSGNISTRIGPARPFRRGDAPAGPGGTGRPASPTPGPRAGTSTADGPRAPASRRPATSASRSTRANGGSWTRPAGCSGRMASIASAATIRRRSPTASDTSANLPGQDSPLAQFYGEGTWAPHGYYSTHSPYKTYDFSRANLLRKHGEEFETAFADITHRRLESWGVNTIANWSDERVYLLRLTPYVGTIQLRGQEAGGLGRLLGQVLRRLRRELPGEPAKAARIRAGQDHRRSLVHRLLRAQRAGLGRRHLAGRGGAGLAGRPAGEDRLRQRPGSQV